MTTPATLVHPYYYTTRLPNGRPYDPEAQGGTVTELVLRSVETSTIVATIANPERVSFGVYRFNIPDTVGEDVYFGEVTWSRSSTSAKIVDDRLVVSLPPRPISTIKPWISLHDLVNYHPDVKGIPADIAMDCIDTATQILYGLSGRKYRGTRITQELYTCNHGGLCGIGASMGYSHLRRAHDPIIQLRQRPVQKVLQVSLDVTGAILPSALWQVANARFLEPTRTGGWSPCQGVRVTYLHGLEPTRAAKNAALALAGNLALSHQGSSACQLPATVTSVSRQGLSFSILDPQDFLQDGRTGLYQVDLFLKTVNPDKARARAKITLSDGPRGRSIAAVSIIDHISMYPLIVQFGRDLDLTYSWRPYGVPYRIGGVYEIRAQAGTTDLTPYITVERDNEPGRIDLNIPSEVASTLLPGTTWYLEARLTTDVTNVQRLLTGEVQQSL